MEGYLQQCKLLGFIDVTLLKKISEAEEWDSLFYELFHLLKNISGKNEILIYNRNRLFFLKREREEKIEIREATSIFFEGREKEYILIIDQNDSHSTHTLKSQVLTHLEKKNIQFTVLDEKPVYLSNLITSQNLAVIYIKR